MHHRCVHPRVIGTDDNDPAIDSQEYSSIRRPSQEKGDKEQGLKADRRYEDARFRDIEIIVFRG